MRKISTFSGAIAIAVIAAMAGAFVFSEIEKYDFSLLFKTQPVIVSDTKKLEPK